MSQRIDFLSIVTKERDALTNSQFTRELSDTFNDSFTSVKYFVPDATGNGSVEGRH